MILNSFLPTPVASYQWAREVHRCILPYAAAGEPEAADSAAWALEGADALLVVTEWKEIRNPDFEAIKAALKEPVIFDGRKLYEPALMKSLGIHYQGVGRGAAA